MKPEEIEQLAEKISVDRAAINHARILADAEEAFEESRRPEMAKIGVHAWDRLPRLVWISGLAAVILIVISCLACYVLSAKVTDLRHELELARQETLPAQPDDTTTINLYLKEHQDVVARHVSYSPSAPQPTQMRVSQHDILYYEFFHEGPEYMHPGIIVRGPSARRQIGPPTAPVISNGHTLTLSEALRIAGFDLVSPPQLHPGYMLDQIRRIEGRDALHLLYTDGINTVSLFQQPLVGQRGLAPQDFREYAVYRTEGQAGGAILAWRDDAVSYVLVGNAKMSQLMDMAQSITAAK